MKHQIKRYKLGADTKHRKSLGINLVRSLILNGRIVTTDAKARYAIALAENLVTVAKNTDLTSYRKILASLHGDSIAAKKLLEYGSKFKDRNGGYCSIVKIGQRLGDGAHQSCLMFCE